MTLKRKKERTENRKKNVINQYCYLCILVHSALQKDTTVGGITLTCETTTYNYYSI